MRLGGIRFKQWFQIILDVVVIVLGIIVARGVNLIEGATCQVGWTLLDDRQLKNGEWLQRALLESAYPMKRDSSGTRLGTEERGSSRGSKIEPLHFARGQGQT